MVMVMMVVGGDHGDGHDGNGGDHGGGHDGNGGYGSGSSADNGFSVDNGRDGGDGNAGGCDNCDSCISVMYRIEASIHTRLDAMEARVMNRLDSIACTLERH